MINKKNELDIVIDEIKPHIIGITRGARASTGLCVDCNVRIPIITVIGLYRGNDMLPEWHHAVPQSAYFKVPETLKTFRMYTTSSFVYVLHWLATRLLSLLLIEIGLLL